MNHHTQQQIRHAARERGFVAAGFVPLGRPQSFERFEQWLNKGAHGTMSYLSNHLDIRADTRKLEPGMKSAIVLLTPYDPRPFDLEAHSHSPIARYALGDDYHALLRKKMRQLGNDVEQITGATCSIRPAVDSAPILERDIAQLAGVGWIGKSNMLINRSFGTYHFISELFVSIDISTEPEPQEDHCGRCTSCIDACPTDAIVEPYYVDAKRCIAYLTIENRGAIPRELRPLIGDHLFGCDICQEVCPWNKFAQKIELKELTPRENYRELSAEQILQLSQHQFSMLFQKSSIKRAKRSGMARNAAVVIGNEGHPKSLNILCNALHTHDEPLVRGHIAWAIAQCSKEASSDIQRKARYELNTALEKETDPYAIEEMAFAHQSITPLGATA